MTDSLRTDTPRVVGLPLRDALQLVWDDLIVFAAERRRPTLYEMAELETRFQDLLDEFDRRTR